MALHDPIRKRFHCELCGSRMPAYKRLATACSPECYGVWRETGTDRDHCAEGTAWVLETIYGYKPHTIERIPTVGSLVVTMASVREAMHYFNQCRIAGEIP